MSSIRPSSVRSTVQTDPSKSERVTNLTFSPPPRVESRPAGEGNGLEFQPQAEKTRARRCFTVESGTTFQAGGFRARIDTLARRIIDRNPKDFRKASRSKGLAVKDATHGAGQF